MADRDPRLEGGGLGRVGDGEMGAGTWTQGMASTFEVILEADVGDRTVAGLKEEGLPVILAWRKGVQEGRVGDRVAFGDGVVTALVGGRAATAAALSGRGRGDITGWWTLELVEEEGAKGEAKVSAFAQGELEGVEGKKGRVDFIDGQGFGAGNEVTLEAGLDVPPNLGRHEWVHGG